jgi:hypothetical protein
VNFYTVYLSRQFTINCYENWAILKLVCKSAHHIADIFVHIAAVLFSLNRWADHFYYILIIKMCWVSLSLTGIRNQQNFSFFTYGFTTLTKNCLYVSFCSLYDFIAVTKTFRNLFDNIFTFSRIRELDAALLPCRQTSTQCCNSVLCNIKMHNFANISYQTSVVFSPLCDIFSLCLHDIHILFSCCLSHSQDCDLG